jgi:two-component system, LuxR family, response regulator FixJ
VRQVMKSSGTVLVADPDGAARSEIARALTRAGYRTIEVGSAAEALTVVRHEEEVDLVLLELELPDMTGYEVCRELRDDYGDALPIIFLSGTRTEALDRVAGLLLGADDFIVKPFDRAELVARVRRFTSRGGIIRLTAVNGHGNGAEHRPLTEREHEILARLAHGTAQKNIAAELEISPKTVGTHIQNLLRKLDAHSRAELVARAWQLNMAELAPRSANGHSGRVH